MTSEGENNSVAKKEPYIIFEIGTTAYGIQSSFVRQLEMIENITPVPNTPVYIDGVMFSRGKVIPVINLRIRFGLERIKYDLKTRVIVIRHEERIVGLIADSAKEYLQIPVLSVQPVPDMPGSSAAWLSGVAVLENRTILILNVNHLLTAEEYKNVPING
jgi:purine-binding chemotaxis protein CheW